MDRSGPHPTPNTAGPAFPPSMEEGEVELRIETEASNGLDLMMDRIYKIMEFTQNLIKELEGRVNRTS